MWQSLTNIKTKGLISPLWNQASNEKLDKQEHLAKAGWTSASATRLCPSRSIDLSPRHNTHLSMLLLCRGSRARTLKLTLQKYYQTCLLSNSFSCPQSKMLGTVQILKEVCLDDFCCLPLCAEVVDKRPQLFFSSRVSPESWFSSLKL